MKQLFVSFFFFFLTALFSAQTDSLIVLKKVDKFGVAIKSQNNIPINYETIKIEKLFIAAKLINGFYDLFSFDGYKIASNIKKYYVLKSDEELQILNNKNEIEYIDSKGSKLDLKKYYVHYYGIYTFEDIETQIDTKKNTIKYLYPASGANDDTLRILQYEQKVPKRIRLISLMSGSSSVFARNHSFFDTLDVNFVVVKISGKYGIWNYNEKKMILPNIYDKINAYQTYLILKRDGLYTIYPQIGEIPKYKYISPFEYFLARFETVDNKKGFIDRYGKEYFDE